MLVAVAAPLALAGMAWVRSLGPRATPSRWIRPRLLTSLTRRHGTGMVSRKEPHRGHYGSTNRRHPQERRVVHVRANRHDPLDHVLGAEADPEIEREMWRAWAFGRHSMWRSRIFGTDGEYRVPDPGSGSTTPATRARTRRWLSGCEGEDCERPVVEVEDPEGAVGRINRAVRAHAAADAQSPGQETRAPIASKGMINMLEACYCGRRGDVEDREPVRRNGRIEALRCPRCGHLDPLPYLGPDARREAFEEAERRSLERLVEGTRT